MRELIELAYDFPAVFDQLLIELELAEEAAESNGRPEWKKPGETAADARDRLRREREEAKARLEAAGVHDRGTRA